MSSKYIYNLTLHCDNAIAGDIRFYIQHVLLPAWKGYDHFSDGLLLERVPSEHEGEVDSASIAIQFRCEGRGTFNVAQDPYLLKVFSTYPDRVLYTESLLKIIE